MWNKLTKLRWNEQTRFFALAGVTAVLLLMALLLPLAFRRTGSGQSSSASGAGEGASNSATELKAALFADYWYGDAGEIEVRKVERPASKTAELCQARMDELVERYINDLALDKPIAQGSEYTVVTGRDTQLRLCRMWLQVQGDWHNWMDVCMDAETGNLYYFYVSRECLTNRGLYSFSPEEPLMPTIPQPPETSRSVITHSLPLRTYMPLVLPATVSLPLPPMLVSASTTIAVSEEDTVTLFCTLIYRLEISLRMAICEPAEMSPLTVSTLRVLSYLTLPPAILFLFSLVTCVPAIHRL